MEIYTGEGVKKLKTKKYNRSHQSQSRDCFPTHGLLATLPKP